MNIYALWILPSVEQSRLRPLDPYRRDRQVIRKRRYGTAILSCLKSHKIADLIDIVAATRNRVFRMQFAEDEMKTDTITSRFLLVLSKKDRDTILK